MAEARGRFGVETERVENSLLAFLRGTEAHLEHLQMARLDAQNRALEENLGPTVAVLRSAAADLAVGRADANESRATLHRALNHCSEAYTFLLRFRGMESAIDLLKGRHELCLGKLLLYALRADLPALQEYWVLPASVAVLPALETRQVGVDVPVGIRRVERESGRSAYSLYVPENYSARREWPLIVCLHGGYSRDDDYLLTWLRAAKSRGLMLLAPKSVRETWSAIRLPGIPPEPSLDRRSIRAMLEEVWIRYAVDRRRVYLTGFSDGGIFTYVLGLAYADLFAGIAPVAGRIHPAVEPIVERGQGKDLPILMVHGARDPIFAVEQTRRTHAALRNRGYEVRYTELPDWGHAYPYSINETIVLPWFEGLPPKSPPPVA